MKKPKIVLFNTNGRVKVHLNCLPHTAVKMTLVALTAMLESSRTPNATNEELAESVREIVLQGLQEVHGDA